ncbi:MAG: triose-phosphate isomerase [bacterium]
MLILNLKTYTESTNDNIYRLLDAVFKLVEQTPKYNEIIFCAVNQLQILQAKEKYPALNFISQSCDLVNQGSTTGSIPVDLLLSAGINYSVINHAEKRVWDENFVSKLDEYQEKMKFVVCCENKDEVNELLTIKPLAIAYENKELIGSGKSITEENPDGVMQFINIAKGKTKVILGAGISSGQDVAKGLEMGAEGFILASAFVKANDPYAKLLELCKPFLKTEDRS